MTDDKKSPNNVQTDLPLSWESESNLEAQGESPAKTEEQEGKKMLLKRSVTTDQETVISHGQVIRNEDETPNYSLDEGAATSDASSQQISPVIKLSHSTPEVKLTPVDEMETKDYADQSHLTVGQTLRQARAGMGASVDKVSAQAKIQKNYIEALENDDFGSLPDNPVFQTQYLRVLCREYNLDTETIVQSYREQSGNSPGEYTKIHTSSDAEFAERASRRPGGKYLNWGLIAALSILVIGLSYGFFVTMNKSVDTAPALGLEKMDFSIFRTPQNLPSVTLEVPR